jgi:hypothetical protein
MRASAIVNGSSTARNVPTIHTLRFFRSARRDE